MEGALEEVPRIWVTISKVLTAVSTGVSRGVSWPPTRA